MVDFNINLAKSMTSTPEQRQRFYHHMLIYLVICAAMLVGVAFLASSNILDAIAKNKQRNQLISSMSALSDYGESFFADPDKAYKRFRNYATDLETLRDSLKERPQFLPVLSQLFNDFPSSSTLVGLTANTVDRSIEFEVVAPVIDDDGNDVLRALQSGWNSNEILQARAHSVTQLTSERNMNGDILMADVRYKCVLK